MVQRIPPLIALAILLAACAQPIAPTRSDYRPLSEAPDLPISPAGQQVVMVWLAKAAPWQTRLATIPADASVAQNLSERTAVDQGLRRLLAETGTATLDPDDRKAADLRIFRVLVAVDTANIVWLKTVLPSDGWFQISRDGRDAAHNAWLLVQHSPDQTFQREVVARMAPLAKVGEVAGADYALLYDRTEVFAGRKQYYGSQYTCEKNHWVAEPTRDPAGVAARRKDLGMNTPADNAARINANGGC